MNSDTSNNNISQINSPSSLEALNFLTNLINNELSSLEAPINNIIDNNADNSTDNSTEMPPPLPSIFNYSRRIYNNTLPSPPRTNPFNTTYQEYDAPNNTNSITDNSQNRIYRQILSDLLNLPPMPERPVNNLEEIINNTLDAKNTYKQVLSKEGEEQIKKIKFNPEIHKETICCPITQVEFKENNEISELPCGHIFDTNAILTWLKTEKAACPCCRYKMPSEEKREEPETPPPLPSRLFNTRQNIPIHPFGPRRRRPTPSLNRIFMSREERLENEELQRALLASLEDQYMPSNNENKDAEKNSPPTDNDEIDIDLYDSDSSDEMENVD